MIKITRGLDLPISGAPDQTDSQDTKTAEHVAVLGPDYMGMKPTMQVRVADQVKKGQVLFIDKKCPRVRYTAPAAGKVEAIHRGAKRALLSVVIHKEGDEEINYKAFGENDLSNLTREQVTEQLLESGLWTALRERPFSKVADPDTEPHSIFITAMDTHPLAPSMNVIIKGQEKAFQQGITVLSHLTAGTLFVCKAPDTNLPSLDNSRIKIEDFSGPHPAGNVGTHIHFLDPVGRHKTVWHIGLQDVIAIGKLFTIGKLNTDRIVAIAGPGATKPRLVKTQLGADINDIVNGEIKDEPSLSRVISGSVLSGRTAENALNYLGRYHQLVSILPEDKKRRFLGWLYPGFKLFSRKHVVLSGLLKSPDYNFSTTTHGEVRAIIPSGVFEDLMPLDIMPLFLMRALAVDDVEEAEALGLLELDEEDLDLCAFACPSKREFGPMLRRNLTIIEKEG